MLRHELRPEFLFQLPRNVRDFAGEITRTVHRYEIQRKLLLTLAAQVLLAGHCAVDEFQCQNVETMRTTTRIKYITRKHGI